MWIGEYTLIPLIGLAIQAIFIQNILLFYFLGMCSYLACSQKISTANGLGLAVFIVTALSGTINWFINRFLTGKGALSWLSAFQKNPTDISLNFLELVIYITVIAALVQILEILIERFFPSLVSSLGMYLPLITVNCAILGACLFATVRAYPFWANFIYVCCTGLGWWLAIVLIASAREKLRICQIPHGLKGMGITFITTGLIALAFLGFSGIDLDRKENFDTFDTKTLTKRLQGDLQESDTQRH